MTRFRASAWSIATFFLIAFPVQVGCAQTTSPDAVARAYVKSLTGGNLEAFWSYDQSFRNSISSALQNLPRTMWNEKTDALRRAWINKIQNDRNPNQQTIGLCWQVFRPGAKADLLETRASSRSNSIESAWQSFVKVSFPSEKDAPIYLLNGSGLRRLHEATVVMQIGRVGPENPGLVVGSSCQVISENLLIWPVPPLGKERALELVKAAIPDGEQPRVTFDPGWGLQFINMFNRTDPENVAQATRLKAIFAKYGVKYEKVQDEQRYYRADGMVPPTSWSIYSLPPLTTFALSETVDFTILTFQQSRDDQVVVTIRIAYNGCNPICNLVKEVNSVVTTPGHVDSATLLFMNPSKVNAGWPKENQKEANYSWDVLQGWRLTFIR